MAATGRTRASGQTRPLRIDLPRGPRAPAAARAELEQVKDAFPEERFEEARLLVSELVTNAVRHGEGSSVRVEVRAYADSAYVEVIDAGDGFGARSAAAARDWEDLELEGGWGLPLVERLADDWGSFEGSTHVWFRLDLQR